MIVFGVTGEIKSANMVFTENELAELKASKLKQGCRTQNGKFVCEYREKESAHLRYVEAINQINNCTFEQWYSRLPKGELMD